MSAAEDYVRYRAAAHAMQSAVRYKMTREGVPDDSEMLPASGETSPKHLRTGVNAAMVDTSAMARLLIAKGVITEDEYVKAIADQMEEEVQLYRSQLGLPDNINFA